MRKFLSVLSHTLTALVVLGVCSLALAAPATQVLILGASGGAATVTNGKLDVNALLTPSGTQDVNLIKVGGTSVALGQTTMSASIPVAIASNQSAVPISGTVSATQGTSPWIVAGGGTAGSPGTAVLTVQGIASGTAQPMSLASGSVASGALASGSVASGAVASGAFSSGAVSSGAYASGSLASGAVVDLTNLSAPTTPATATATKSILLGGTYNSTKPTFTDTQQGSLQLGSRGSLLTTVCANDLTNCASTAALDADGLAATGTSNSLRSVGFPFLFNGSTYDRWRSSGTTGEAAVGGLTASGATDAGNPVKAGGKFNSTKPTFTDGQRGDLQIGSRGSLNVTLCGSAEVNCVTTAALDADGLTATSNNNTIRATDFPFIFNGTSFDRTRSVITGTNSVGTGILAAGVVGQCDDTSPQAITENQFGNARIDCATHAVVTTPVPSATAGGLTWYNVEPGASDNHANIKNGAGVVYHVTVFSKHTAAQYLRLYNAASGFNGCNSATNLIWSGIIPGSPTGSGFVDDIALGITFATGISICVTGAYGQTDTTNATASVMEVNVGYK